jgi:hypothetical protein
MLLLERPQPDSGTLPFDGAGGHDPSSPLVVVRLTESAHEHTMS